MYGSPHYPLQGPLSTESYAYVQLADFPCQLHICMTDGPSRHALWHCGLIQPPIDTLQDRYNSWIFIHPAQLSKWSPITTGHASLNLMKKQPFMSVWRTNVSLSTSDLLSFIHSVGWRQGAVCTKRESQDSHALVRRNWEIAADDRLPQKKGKGLRSTE